MHESTSDPPCWVFPVREVLTLSALLTLPLLFDSLFLVYNCPVLRVVPGDQ